MLLNKTFKGRICGSGSSLLAFVFLLPNVPRSLGLPWKHGSLVQLHSDHTNLLVTKRLSFSGLLKQRAATETQERMWPKRPFVAQNLVTEVVAINRFGINRG